MPVYQGPRPDVPGMKASAAGKVRVMSVSHLHLRGRGLAPLAVVTIAAAVFAVLLVLVRLRWAPLESVDHGAAARINHLVAGNGALVTAVKAVTWLGSDGVLWVVVGVAAVILAIRKRWWLAVYLLVTAAGALVLDPVLKSLVGRPRAAGRKISRIAP